MQNYFSIPMTQTLPEPQEILEKVCDKYNVTLKELKGKDRKREVVFARHLAMYLIYSKTALSKKKVSSLFNRDHTTVIHGIRQIENYIETNSFNKREEIIKFI